MKVKHIVLLGIGLAIFAAAIKIDNNFLRGVALYFFIWAAMADTLNGVTIIKKEATTINPQHLDVHIEKGSNIKLGSDLTPNTEKKI